MRELIVTNDAVLLNYVETLLSDQGIDAVVLDRNMSLMEGSIGAFPRRLMVPDEAWPAASRLLQDAGLGQWVRSDGRS